MKQYRNHLWKLVVLGVLAPIVSVLMMQFFAYHRKGVDSPSAERFRNAHLIGRAIRAYTMDQNGKFPVRLSDLFPRYMDLTNLNCFFSPSRNEIKNLLNMNEWRDQIDVNGDFVYLGTNCVEEDLIMHERLSLWPAHPTVDAPGVTTLTTNLTALRLPISDLRRRLARCSEVRQLEEARE